MNWLQKTAGRFANDIPPILWGLAAELGKRVV